MKLTNGVRRTWSMLENGKRKVEKVVMNLEKEDKLRVVTM